MPVQFIVIYAPNAPWDSPKGCYIDGFVLYVMSLSITCLTRFYFSLKNMNLDFSGQKKTFSTKFICFYFHCTNDYTETLMDDETANGFPKTAKKTSSCTRIAGIANLF